jgi:hypothetical protein
MERAAAGLGLRLSLRYGAAGATGRFSSLRPGDLDTESRAELSWLVSPLPRLQIGVVVPALVNVRRLGGLTEAGYGTGDITASARWDLVPLAGAGVWPAVALTAACTLPTGRPLAEAHGVLGAGATGLGAAELRPGLFVEKNFDGKASAILAASIGLRTSTSLPDGERVHLGPRLRIVAAVGPIFPNGASLSAGLVHEREPGPSIGGVVAPGSDRRRTAVLAFAGYDFAARWTALASLEVDLPWLGLARNELAAVAVAVGLRRAFLNHD